MTSKKVLKVLNHLGKGIDNWGSVTSPDFTLFTREFKSMILEQLKKIGGTDYEQRNGHYYVYGFFKVGEQPFYISISDVRHFTIEDILIRTAKDYKDFTGGSNHYLNIQDGMFKKLPDMFFELRGV